MQLRKGVAACGLTVAALVAGGSVVAPAWATTGPPATSGVADAAPAGGRWGTALPESAPTRGAPKVVSVPAGAGPSGVAPSGVAPSAATTAPAVAIRAAACRSAPPPRYRQWLDGFVLGWVPPGLGPLVTDFEYEWEDVGFRSRVWESGPYPDESYRVDLQITVMRSPSFTDVAAMREFLVEYLERDPAAWATEPFAHPDGPGLADVGELFWLAEAGVAVRVLGGGERVDPRDLTRTACAVRQVMPVR